MLIHIHYKHRHNARRHIEVMSIQAVIMKLPVIQAVAEDYPSPRSHSASLEILLPFFKRAELLCYQISKLSRRFFLASGAQVFKIRFCEEGASVSNARETMQRQKREKT